MKQPCVHLNVANHPFNPPIRYLGRTFLSALECVDCPLVRAAPDGPWMTRKQAEQALRILGQPIPRWRRQEKTTDMIRPPSGRR